MSSESLQMVRSFSERMEKHGILLNSNVLWNTKQDAAAGGNSRIYTCQLEYSSKNKVKIALKSLKQQSELDLKFFFQEMYAWSKLNHENLLPMLGGAIEESTSKIYIVSPWIERGMVPTYLQNVERSHRTTLAGSFLHDVAAAIKYLHDQKIYHGDIKGRNVLVSDNDPPRAIVADFGLSTVIEHSLTIRHSYGYAGTPKYIAPEVLNPKTEQEYPERGPLDIFAYGRTIEEFFTGEPNCGPRKKRLIPDAWLSLCEICTSPDPNLRPSANLILERLSQMSDDKYLKFKLQDKIRTRIALALTPTDRSSKGQLPLVWKILAFDGDKYEILIRWTNNVMFCTLMQSNGGKFTCRLRSSPLKNQRSCRNVHRHQRLGCADLNCRMWHR